jgi:hypothetical protein
VAHKLANLVGFTTATTGTGTVTVGSALTGLRTPASDSTLADGDTVAFFIKDGTAWEHSTGVLGSTKTTLTRVLRASSTGSLLSLSGSAEIRLMPGAADLPNLNAANLFSGTVSVTNGAATADNAYTGLSTSHTQAIIEQTGAVYGTSRLRIGNENFMNGAMFEQAGSVNLVDFIFRVTSTGLQCNIRMEGRTTAFISATNTSWEFQIGNPNIFEYMFGDTLAKFIRPLITAASTATLAGLNLPPGTAPTSPVNGDLWMTSTGFFARVNGATKQLAEAKSLVTIFTASGTYTPTTGAVRARIQVQGGGGSGGSSAGAASNVGAASGGGAGGYAEKLLDLSTISSTGTVTVGAGGSAPASGNNAGNAGSLSSFAATGMTTVSAPGGSAGGASGAAGTSVVGVAGGAETAAPTGGDLNVPGAAGFPGWRFSGTQGFAGQGAPSFFGGGGRAPAATGAGGAAGVYGAGGAGALSIGNTNSAGGAGKAGIVIVTEYF